ncbi:MAG: caspase family protein [Actinomycetota bacterium]|nr:caspase family protein [Actinomycetota bacterium]
MTTFALLVGIDRYLPPINALYGCVNDSVALERYLQARSGDALKTVVLRDADATRAAVVDAFRAHLGQAGPGDVALFAYAGHGSEEPVPEAIARFESSGKIQTLVLADCGRRIGGKLVRGLADKELAVLLAEVSGRSAHTVAIFDCCHSGGADRDVFTNVRGWTAEPDQVTGEEREIAVELATARPVSEFIPGALEQWTAPAANHVALAACQSFEKAKEHRVGDTTRGAFSTALIESLELLGPRTTYRTLLNTVRSRVERAARDQRPELFPLDAGSRGDGLFLEGSIVPAPASFTMTSSATGWQIDGGLVHGLRDPVGDDAFVLACRDLSAAGAPAADPAVSGTVRLTSVTVGTAAVEPLGWTPQGAAYSAVVIDVPLPRAEVAFDPPGRGLEVATADVRAAVERAVATAGAGDAPSAHVRIVDDDADAAPGALRLRVGVPAAGTARIMRADGGIVATDVRASEPAAFGSGAARLVVSRLEHVARWEQVRALGEHPSPLVDVISLHLYTALPGETQRPADRKELVASGGHRVEYSRAPDGTWAAPYVFIDVRNDSDEQLHVAVLDLTDRYKSQVLQQTTPLGGAVTFALVEGKPIPVRLPGRPADPQPGSSARDWLQVLVSDEPFDASSFTLPALDQPQDVARGRTRGRARGLLERLADKAVTRDVGDDEPVAARWGASTVTLEVAVPAAT